MQFNKYKLLKLASTAVSCDGCHFSARNYSVKGSIWLKRRLHVQQKLCVFGAVPQSFAACSCSNCALAFLSDYMIKMHFNPTAREKNAAVAEF
jgi:hypothetical protein